MGEECLGECFVPCRVHRRVVPGGVFCPVQGSWERSAYGRVLPRAGFIVEECPDDNGGSVFCRAGFIGEELRKECFFFFSHIGIVGKECLMTPGEALCVVQGPSTGST